jgi:amidophosphoribosyltransferase
MPRSSPPFDDDAPREACGVAGLATPASDAAPHVLSALHTLQHRGQDSAGLASHATGLHLHVTSGLGLVAEALPPAAASRLPGRTAIGHVRYATSGDPTLASTQPLRVETDLGPAALAHNGHLTNTRALLRALGLPPAAALTDSALLGRLLAHPAPGEPTDASRLVRWRHRLDALLTRAEGAFALVVLTPDALFAVRDPHGLRPLVAGAHGRSRGVASETAALVVMGLDPLGDLPPGTVTTLAADRLDIAPPSPSASRPPTAFCAFEHVYFAAPTGHLEGRDVAATRRALGAALALEAPVAADVVVGVPSSALPAAEGFATALGLPLLPALARTPEARRSFIEPDPSRRAAAVASKFRVDADLVAGRRVALVDDSLVRGTTLAPVVALLREAGAIAIDVRVSSPPVLHPCYMGVAMPDRSELIRTRHDTAALAVLLGADSLAFLSEPGMRTAIAAIPPRPWLATAPPSPPRARGLCTACFSGTYPLEVLDVLPD